jgi:hypothetical protein
VDVIDEIPALIPALRTSLLDRWGDGVLEPQALAGLTAVALVHKCWRNTELEGWHSDIDPAAPSDYDMFRANITLTRAVLPAVAAHPLDVVSVRLVFTDPNRPSGVGRTARKFCGPSWGDVEATAHGVLDLLDDCIRRVGEEDTRVFYASQSSAFGWWCTPGFSDRLRASFRAHRPDVVEEQVAELVEHPEGMTEAMFDDVVFYRSEMMRHA